MRVTLINTQGRVDVSQKTPSGDVIEIGSFNISVANPAFIAAASDFVASLDLSDTTKDYTRLTDECNALVFQAATNPDEVRAIMGSEPNIYTSLSLLTAVLQEAANIDAMAQIEQLQKELLVPDMQTIANEMARS